MGLFSRRGQRSEGRRLDGNLPVSNGDVGGDAQRGDSWSVRFAHSEKPGSLITVSFYAVETGRGEFGVERQVEWMVCEDREDPGGTEIWSDYAYDAVTEEVISSAAAAEREAREFAEAALGDVALYAGWDGEPDWGAA